MAKQNSWTTDSGLFEGRGKVTGAIFRTDAEYQDGEIAFLELTIKPKEAGEDERKVRYGCGAKGGWEPTKKGIEIVSSAGKTRFHSNSAVGLLVTSIANAAKEGKKLDELQKKGDEFSATTFIGIDAEFETVKMKYGGEIGDIDRTLVAKIYALGAAKAAKDEDEDDEDEDEKPAKSAKPAAKTAEKKAAKSAAKEEDDEEDDEGDDEEVDPALVKKIRAAAKKAKDYDQFVIDAYAIDGVDGNAAAEALVSNEGEGGIWHEVNG